MYYYIIIYIIMLLYYIIVYYDIFYIIIYYILIYIIYMGFPCGTDGKEFTCNARRPGFNPWIGKIPWRREELPTPGY